MITVSLLAPLIFGPFEANEAGAVAASPVKWHRYANNPVLSPGPYGSWDADSSQFYMGCMLVDGDEYKMYYQGFDGVRYKIGLATSTDGVTWTKYDGNPVISTGYSGSWESKGVGGPTVIKDGSTYKMWYHGGNSTNYRLGYATSSDGKSWTKYSGNPIIDIGGGADFDSIDLAFPCVLKENDTFKMWYTGYDSTNSAIGYATSSDGINWTKYSGNAVLDISPNNNWDDTNLAGCKVLNISGEYRMWYGGNSAQHWGTGYATSADGISWKRYAHNPVLKGNGDGWEAHDAFMPTVIFNGTTYQMWYTGVDNSWVQQIGYAEGWNTIPNPPVLTAPANDKWLTDNRSTFKWTFKDPDEWDTQTAYQVQFANDSEFGSVDCDTGKVSSSSTSYTPNSPLKDGIYYWRARVWDSDDDNSTWSPARAIWIDSTPPDSLNLSIDNGTAYTNQILATLSISANDPSPGSGLANMAFSNDGTAWSAWEGFAATRKSWDLTSPASGGNDSDGNKYVFAKVNDVAGNEILPQNRARASIFLDRVSPEALSISIDGGADYTNSSDVTLALSASDPEPASGLWMMALSNDGVTWSGWMDWNQQASWSLTAGAGGSDVDGNKAVFFKVMDRAGNIGASAKAGIFLDRRAPGNLGVTINGGADYTNSSDVGLAILATDPDPSSLISGMTLANSAGGLGNWESFSDSKSGWSLIAGTGGADSDGTKTVYLQVRDNAGNVGGPVDDTIFLDRARPGNCSILINGGAVYSISRNVQLTLSATDPEPASGVGMMQFSDDGGTWTGWENFSGSRSYTLPAPDGSKTVYFRAKDRAGNIGDVVFASIILDTQPPVISHVRTSVSDTTAIISWTTDEEADSGVDYGLTAVYSSSRLNSTYVIYHSILLDGLTPVTTYHFQVHSTDKAGNLPAYAGDYAFITLATPDTTPPVLSDVKVSGITDRLAVVSWTTNEPADSAVEYGPGPGYGSLVGDPNFVLIHSLKLDSLSPATTYHCRVSSSDPSGNGPARSDDITFVTLTTPDTTPPVISNVTSSGITDRLAVISWETDEPADGVVDFGTSAVYGSSVSLPALGTRHEAILNGLQANTVYHFRVKSRDATGNGPAASGDLTFRTNEQPDTSPPYIMNLRAEAVGGTSAVIRWETGKLADGSVDYGLDTSYGLSSSDPGFTLEHGFLLQGLARGTVYHLRARSIDPSGNEGTSPDFTFQTKNGSTGSDTTPPVISDLEITGISDTRAVVLWLTDEPADGEVDYGNTTSYGLVSNDPSLVSFHSTVLGGLVPSTKYHVRVKSTDSFGNGPTLSTDMTFTTASGPDITPPRISSVSITGVTNTSAVITWSTDEPANSLVEYGADTHYGRDRTCSTFEVHHSIELSGLSPATKYHFRVGSTDPSANDAVPSGDMSFTTTGGLGPSGPTAPKGSGITISEGTWIFLVVGLLVVMAAIWALAVTRIRAKGRAGPASAGTGTGVAPPTARPPPDAAAYAARQSLGDSGVLVEDSPGVGYAEPPGKVEVIEMMSTEEFENEPELAAAPIIAATPSPTPPRGTGGRPSEAEILRVLTSLPRGLPSTLWGMDIEELAAEISAGDYRQTAQGDLLVKVRNKWYFGDHKEIGTYMQLYRGK